MNTEAQDKLLDSGEILPVMEAFYTIQGEGHYSGSPAYFIRVGGCDVGCHWCDVKESWDANLHPATSTDSIVEQAIAYSNTVVITGGEPLNWNMDYITQKLHEKGARIHIETSGSSNVSGHWDWICLSPKKTKLPVDEIYPMANELKMIIHNKSDFEFAKQQGAKVSKNCILLLQPEWSKREKMMPLITDFVMENPEWKVSLQTHKYMNIP